MFFDFDSSRAYDVSSSGTWDVWCMVVVSGLTYTVETLEKIQMRYWLLQTVLPLIILCFYFLLYSRFISWSE